MFKKGDIVICIDGVLCGPILKKSNLYLIKAIPNIQEKCLTLALSKGNYKYFPERFKKLIVGDVLKYLGERFVYQDYLGLPHGHKLMSLESGHQMFVDDLKLITDFTYCSVKKN